MLRDAMKRYAAFLRGVSPMNCRMPELKRALESAGFEDVKTMLSSGNVVFSSPAAPLLALERNVEAAMEKHMGRSFPTIIRSIDALQRLLESDPYAAPRLKPGSKRVVTFLRRKPKATLELPIEFEQARILAVHGCEVFSSYVPGPKGPVFMTLIEKTFGKEVTTRTWETIQKVAR
jgi:uncharacterized protein (DUF1697 family)